MLLRIEHTTSYKYSAPVFAEPHHLYFYPVNRSYLQLLSFDLQVLPVPTGLALRVDIENNPYHQCWFDGMINSMSIAVKLEIETTPFNFLDFLIEDNPKTDHDAAIQLYLNPRMTLSSNVHRWILSLKRSSEANAIAFLGRLCQEIHDGWTHTISYASQLRDPSDCFEDKSGSCRDLSWMMIEMLREQKIPARFVSGYCHNPELEEGHELHAWVEAWVAGAGWIGLDPSSGLFTTADYISVAASYHPANTLPVQGSYRGKATSKLETSVRISVL